MSIASALLYLRLTSLRNVIRLRLRRMRQPKYLVGALVGVAYFWFFFFRRRGPGNPAQVFGLMFGAGNAEWIASIVLTLFLVLVWATAKEEPGLAFTEAEVAFLFPAPLQRRQLIHYKLLNGLASSLFGAAFFALLSRGIGDGGTGFLRYLGFWWTFTANLSFHQTASALTLAWMSAAGLRARRRRILVLSLVAAVLLALVFSAWVFGFESLSWALWPARILIRPYLAEGWDDYLLALAPAIALLVLHYFWILQIKTPFEEASIARAQYLGEAIARIRSGRRVPLTRTRKAQREPFPLSPRLPLEFAFLWKNLMAAPSFLSFRTFRLALLLSLVGCYLLRHAADPRAGKIATAVGGGSLFLLGYLLVIGAQLARNDLRGDMVNADLLKSYPVRGWRIVLGNLLAPAVTLTGVGWFLMFTAAMALPPPRATFAWLTGETRLAVVAAIALVMPALFAVQLLVPNAAILLFPGWMQTTRTPGGGMDMVGQRVIFFFGQMFCLAIALIPAGVIVLLVWLTGGLLFKLPPAVLALISAPLVLAVLALETWLGVQALGLRFEALDLSAEMRS